jgi:hypothetical protein
MWTLVALIVTSVGPVVTAALGESSGQRDEHACCPEKVGEGASASRTTDAPLPCCAIGSGNPETPVGTPTVVRATAPQAVPILAPFWSQSLAPRVEARPHTGPTLGPIPLVIRTSVLLI